MTVVRSDLAIKIELFDSHVICYLIRRVGVVCNCDTAYLSHAFIFTGKLDRVVMTNDSNHQAAIDRVVIMNHTNYQAPVNE